MFATPDHVYIIAEAGVNHNGDIKKAYELIDIAVSAGADAVKFQLFRPEALVTKTAKTAAYQATNLKDDAISQQQMLEKLTLPDETLIELHQYCTDKNIDFLCTPFDHSSLEYLLENTPMPFLKLASGEVANGPLLLAAARTKLPIILSTGMSSLDEISTALSILHFGYYNASGNPDKIGIATPDQLVELREHVTILHCVSQYPAPIESTNLLAMDSIEQAFALPVGYSDHTLGIAMATAAAARGAVMLEKHFTYDQKAQGPDHAASLSPEELHDMVKAVRDVSLGFGNGEKRCQKIEESTRQVARRSVVAKASIAKGEAFTDANLVCKRPSDGGVAPNQYWQLLGKTAQSDYAADDFIQPDELKAS